MDGLNLRKYGMWMLEPAKILISLIFFSYIPSYHELQPASIPFTTLYLIENQFIATVLFAMSLAPRSRVISARSRSRRD